MNIINKKTPAIPAIMIILFSLIISLFTGEVKSSAAVIKIPRGKLTSVASDKKGQMTVKWKKLKGVSGYRIKIASNKKFSKRKKLVIVKSKKITSVKLNKLKPGQTYYVKITGYKKFKSGGKYKEVSGKYSKVKKVKIKKTDTIKYKPEKIRSILDNANTLTRTLSLLNNDDGSGYTKYSYLDWSDFSFKLSSYKARLKTAEYKYKVIRTKKFKKAYNKNKKYTYKDINGKKVSSSARKIYKNLYDSAEEINSGISDSLNNLQRKSIQETWKHYNSIRTSVDDFAFEYFIDGMTEYEKITIIYNYLCDKIYYEKSNPSKYGYDLWKSDSTLYRVFTSEGNDSAAGVCGTYTCAFQMMCQYYGIKSQVLCSDDHTWNTVEIDGVWYTCDLTIGDECNYGDDDITQNISKYFNKYFYTEKDMSTAFKRDHNVQSILPEYYYFFIKPSENFSLVSGGDSLRYRFING